MNKLDFESFFGQDNIQIGNPIYLKGGADGKITGSRINAGNTYVDIEWFDGSPDSCDNHLPNTTDGSYDDHIGQLVWH